jgi:DNA-directed RNA polymerase III subunit RPC4
MADKGTEPKKFQTRAGISRKTKEEREQYARDEATRQQQRLAEAAQDSTSGAPEKGRSSVRGRSSVAPNSTNRIRSENSGGVFGAAAPPVPKTRGGRLAGTVSTTLGEIEDVSQNESSKETTSNAPSKKFKAGEEPTVKSEKKSTAKSRGAKSKKDDSVYLSSEDDVDEGARRDIEQIWISSDEEAVSSTSKGKQREKSSVRHSTALRPLRAPRDSRVEGEALSARNRVVTIATKNEAGLTDEDASRGPTMRDESAMDITSDKMLPPPSGDVDRKTSKRKGARLKDAIAVTETAEEHAERLRYNEEVLKLVGELDHHRSSSQVGGHQQGRAEHFHDRRLYLFQFPPLTPVLVDPTEEIEVKQEPETEFQPVQSASEKIGSAAVKKEEGVEERTKRKSDVMTADNMQLPSGLAGTLRVHKSGKVTLDWGGTDLEVRYGTEVDFLQDVVMADETEQAAWAVGQVEKKMVCIPNWQKLYE